MSISSQSLLDVLAIVSDPQIRPLLDSGNYLQATTEKIDEALVNINIFYKYISYKMKEIQKQSESIKKHGNEFERLLKNGGSTLNNFNGLIRGDDHVAKTLDTLYTEYGDIKLLLRNGGDHYNTERKKVFDEGSGLESELIAVEREKNRTEQAYQKACLDRKKFGQSPITDNRKFKAEQLEQKICTFFRARTDARIKHEQFKKYLNETKRTELLERLVSLYLEAAELLNSLIYKFYKSKEKSFAVIAIYLFNGSSLPATPTQVNGSNGTTTTAINSDTLHPLNPVLNVEDPVHQITNFLKTYQIS